MLEVRPCCENCGKDLPYNATDAMICTFECAFCTPCVEDKLDNICPNCGGNFEKRPIRPENLLKKYPVSEKRIVKPKGTSNKLYSYLKLSIGSNFAAFVAG